MKKFVSKTLSLFLAATLLVVALPLAAFAEEVCSFVHPGHTHLFEEYIWEEKEYYSIDKHQVIIHTTEQCAVCGVLSNNEVVTPALEDHYDIDVRSSWDYDYDSNEYHIKIEYSHKIYLCCDGTIVSKKVAETLEEHVIDPSVDQEVYMEGACIHCGETIYW